MYFILNYFPNFYQCINKKSIFQYEKPNPYLYSFKGNFEIDVLNNEKKLIGLDQKNFLLRGCSLRNTNYIIGVVAYTG